MGDLRESVEWGFGPARLAVAVSETTSAMRVSDEISVLLIMLVHHGYRHQLRAQAVVGGGGELVMHRVHHAATADGQSRLPATAYRLRHCFNQFVSHGWSFNFAQRVQAESDGLVIA